MTSYSWTTGVSADWTTAADWDTGTVPNDPAADVTIDAQTTIAQGYTITIAAGETETVNSLTMTSAATLQLNGTLAFAPASSGLLGGTVLAGPGVATEIVNGGTLDGFIQSEGDLLLTGTNTIDVTGYLQASSGGTITIEASSIADITGTALSDGQFEAQGAGSVVNLGGTLAPLVIVNIGTIEGPPGQAGGWTALYLNGQNSEIDEWAGTNGYVPVESTLTNINAGGLLNVLGGRDYTTAQTLTIEGGTNDGAYSGILNLQAGTVTTAGISIAGGIVQGFATIVGGVDNDGTLMALGGTLDLTGSLTGTGTVGFDYDSTAFATSTTGATLEVNSVSTGQTIVMNGDDTLILNTPSAFAGTIAATVGDRIVLQGVTATSAVLTNGTLVVSDGTIVVDSLTLSGSYAGDGFLVSGSAIQITGELVPPVVTLATTPAASNTATAILGTAAPGTGGDALSVALTSDADFATGSTLALSNGSLVYTPGVVTAAKAGTDTLTYTVTDTVTGAVTTETQTVALSALSSDILFQNQSGQIAQWTVSGSSIASGGYIGGVPGPSWFAVGTGAFYTGDTSDIVWQNTSGAVALWQVQGTSQVGGAILAINPGSTWHIKGTGDFYGDGNTDILWQNDNGSVAVWDMKGASIVQGAVVAANPGPTWHIEAVGDFNDDGKADIAWQNDNGSVAVWDMKGTNIVSGAVLANPGTSWSVLGGDQNMRFIYSGVAGESLAASPVAPDEFVFTNVGGGGHTITGFNVTQDMIELSSAVFGSFAAVEAATSATASGAMIHLGASSSLFMAGVDPRSLHASNFALS